MAGPARDPVIPDRVAPIVVDPVGGQAVPSTDDPLLPSLRMQFDQLRKLGQSTAPKVLLPPLRAKSKGTDGGALLRSGAMSWLPDDFVHPVLVPLPGSGHHLRPIREADTPLDYPAVMGSRERLWTIFGPAWGWPAATMTYEADQADLLRHEKEIAAHQSFNYALFDAAETALLGCVYIDPPERAGADGEISWWVVDELVDSKVEQALDELVPQWIAADWPFEQPRFLGREISWSDWLALPKHPDA